MSDKRHDSKTAAPAAAPHPSHTAPAPDRAADGAPLSILGSVIARTGPDPAGPLLHGGPDAQAALAGLGAIGASVGRHVLLSDRLGAAARRTVLSHELAHVAQTGARDPAPGRPLGIAPRSDPSEADARRPEPRITGADPSLVRLWGEDEVCAPENATTPEDDPSAAVSMPEVSETDDPLAALPEFDTTPPEEQVCEPPQGASFDPEAIDVDGMANLELNAESLRVDDWLAAHAEESHPDSDAYRRYRDRLKASRTARVASGHLWMMRASAETPAELLMLMPLADRTSIVSVGDAAHGPVNESPPGPIMSRAQFDAHLAGIGAREMTEEEYYAEQGAGAAPAPDPLMAGFPFGGDEENPWLPSTRIAARSQRALDLRGTAMAEALGRIDANQRFGRLGEAMFMTGPGTLGGFGAGDYNTSRPRFTGDPLRPFVQPWGNYPAADARIFGEPSDVSIKTPRHAGTAASQDPNIRRRLATLYTGHAAMLDTGSTSFQEHMRRSGGGRTPEQVAAEFRLAAPADMVEAYAADIADPTRVADPSRSGAKASWELIQYKKIYSRTRLPQPIAVTGASGQTVQVETGADLYAAHEAGRIDRGTMETHIRTIAATAAGQTIPIADYDAGVFQRFQAFEDQFVHPSLQHPVAPEIFKGSSGTAKTSVIERYGGLLDGRLTKLAQSGPDPLYMEPAQAAQLRQVLENPTGFDVTEKGKASRDPNWNRASVKRFYDTVLAGDPITLPDGSHVTSVADLLDATKGDAAAQAQAFADLGAKAGGRVQDLTPAIEARASQQAPLREQALARRQRYADAEIAGAIKEGSLDANGRLTLDANPGASSAGKRGGWTSAGVAVLLDPFTNPDAALSAEYGMQLGGTALTEGAWGGVDSYAQHQVEARTQQYVIQRGLTGASQFAVRAAGRVPFVDLVREGYSLSQDAQRRDVGAGEVTYRLGAEGAKSVLAAEVGAVAGAGFVAMVWGSAATGAVAGTVVPGWGTAIGFVIGIGIGVGTYTALDWAERKYARPDFEGGSQGRLKPTLGDAARRVVADLQAEQERQRLMQFDVGAASVAGIEAMPPGLDVDPMFLQSSAETDALTIPEFQAAYLRAYLREMQRFTGGRSGPG